MEPVKQVELKSEESALVTRPRTGSIANSVTVTSLEVTSSMASMTMTKPEVSEAALVKAPGFEAGIPGTAFVLVNARYPGQALTIDMVDRKSVVGYPTQFGQNQQWEFVPSGAGFAIRSMLPGGKKLYLSVGDWRGCEDVPVVVSAFPVAWEVEGSKKGIRIGWPNSDVGFELEEDYDGNSVNNKVVLRPTASNRLSQVWRYHRVTTIQECK